MISTAILAALLIAWALHTRALARERVAHNDRVDEIERAHTAQMQKLLAARDPDLEQMVALVDRLCQRVQAPVQAVIDHTMGQRPPESPPAVGFDDDDAFFAAREMSKEQLAEALMEAEVTGVAG